MPGACRKRYELHQLAVAANQHMRRHLETANFLKVRMAIAVQPSAKQLLNRITTKLAGRQTDAVQDNELDFGTDRSRILVRASALPRRGQRTGTGVYTG